MGFNRIEAKIQAKTSIRLGKPSALRVSLVYLVLTALLSSVIRAFGLDLWEPLLYYIQRGYGMEEILNIIWSQYSGQIMLQRAIGLVLGLYTTVMSFGYISYTLRLARNEDPGYTHLFDGFVKFWRVLWMNFLRYLFIALWTLLAMLPVFALFVVLILTEADEYALMGAGTLAVVWGAVAGVVITLRYCLAEYFLLDDPSRTARTCITLSKKAMKGWKMERFTLSFSFLGWALLGELLVAGLSEIWLVAGLVGMLLFNMWYMPYYWTTLANFYDCVSGRADPFPRGGSDWDSRMKDFNDAFDNPGL